MVDVIVQVRSKNIMLEKTDLAQNAHLIKCFKFHIFVLVLD